MKISRPSPALIVSIVSLVVACAGTATAASFLIKSSAQVRASSINGVDIENGSLKGVDLADSTITGKEIKKNTIAAEDLAPAVRNSLRAPSGLTAQEVVRREGPNKVAANAVGKVATIAQLEPGTYFIVAKTTITSVPATFGLGELLRQNKTGNAECTIDAGGDVDKGRATVVTPTSASPQTVNLQMTRTIDSPTDVVLSCAVNDFDWRATDTSIIALRLQGSTRVDTTE